MSIPPLLASWVHDEQPANETELWISALKHRAQTELRALAQPTMQFNILSVIRENM